MPFRNCSRVFDRLPARIRPHVPIRPVWLCRVCAGPWPCSVARLQLKCEYGDDRVALSVHMASVLHDAVEDLYRLNPSDLDLPDAFARFVGWTAGRPM